MSPLSPLTIEAAKSKDSKPSNLLVTSNGLGSRFHYSVNQLYDLRHEENIVPRISDRTVFDSVRRSGNNTMSNQFNMFNNSGSSSSLNRLGGRSNRSIFRPPTLLSSDLNNPQNSNQRNSGNNFQNSGNFNRGSGKCITRKKKKLSGKLV